jgi:DNA replication licensing factor MCM2
MFDGADLERDYREMPALDKYENRMLDNREYDDIAAEARRAAEADMRRRERREMQQSGRGTRLPAALQDSDDDMSDFEPQALARRRMAERAAGEDVGEYDEDDVDFALEDFGDVPLSEWLAQDRPRAEIKKQFKTFLRTYGGGSGECFSRLCCCGGCYPCLLYVFLLPTTLTHADPRRPTPTHADPPLPTYPALFFLVH